jgi:hypothetical protein
VKATDTESRRSIVSDTLQSLGKEARAWRAKIDLLEAGQHTDRAEALAELGKLLDLSQNLRDAILSEDSGATWTTKSELDTLVSRLDEVAAKRQRYLDLAQRLQAGTMTHRRERTREERLRQRDAAVTELMEISGQGTPPELPGPVVAEWLEWACSLDDSTNDPDVKALNTHFPRVDDFIRQLEIELWHDGPATAPLNGAAEKPHSDAGSGSKSSGSGNGLSIEEAPAEKAPADAYAEAAAARLDEPGAAVATAEVPATEQGKVEDEAEVPRTPRAKGADGVSFFAADEVDCMSLYLDKAKKEPKGARKVRALVAISHWLTPANQNPALHAKCGIQVQIGYASKRVLEPVGPAEAEKVIAAESGLPLLAGGADLLRWSVEHASEGRFDATASLRRMTIGQLKAWFGDVFKIELAEPQVLDMYRLTYGIPLLVGELHHKIIPMHDNPPSWLGFAIWTRIKQAFNDQIPALARELKDGPAAVRLTERELALLKMVVIASEDSTPETLVSNLMEGWHRYRRPELQPLSSADEASVQVLESLGLLPMRTEWASRPLKALMPVELDDPIRQIVSHL